MFPNISGSKGNQKMKFGQLIGYNKSNVFSSKVMQKKGQGDLFLFFEKALYEVKESGLQLSFNIFR